MDDETSARESGSGKENKVKKGILLAFFALFTVIMVCMPLIYLVFIAAVKAL